MITIILETLSPYIKKNLNNNTRQEIRRVIIGYVDRNSDVLYAMDLASRISFSDNDRNNLYKIFGLDENIVQDAVNKSSIHKSNKIQSNPFYCFCEVLLHELNNITSDKKVVREDCILVATYMSFMMYVSAHFGFAKYGVNQEIMNYTINNLDNNFKLRQFSSVFLFIKDNAEVWFDKYDDLIKKCDDKSIAMLNDTLHTRIKAKLKNIFSKYYDNHKHGRYLNYESDSYSEEDYHIMDNDTYVIDRLVNKTYTKLINKQFDKRLIKYSIDSSDVSLDKLTKIIDDIVTDTDDKRVMEFISAAINYYARTYGIQNLSRGEFISDMKRTYASNTKDELMNRMKEIIEQWLDENMYKYGRATYGNTVKNQYRKSLFMFFIFVINMEAKTMT